MTFLELFMWDQQELGDYHQNAHDKFKMEVLAGCVTDAKMAWNLVRVTGRILWNSGYNS